MIPQLSPQESTRLATLVGGNIPYARQDRHKFLASKMRAIDPTYGIGPPVLGETERLEAALLRKLEKRAQDEINQPYQDALGPYHKAVREHHEIRSALAAKQAEMAGVRKWLDLIDTPESYYKPVDALKAGSPEMADVAEATKALRQQVDRLASNYETINKWAYPILNADLEGRMIHVLQYLKAKYEDGK